MSVAFSVCCFCLIYTQLFDTFIQFNILLASFPVISSISIPLFTPPPHSISRFVAEAERRERAAHQRAIDREYEKKFQQVSTSHTRRVLPRAIFVFSLLEWSGVFFSPFFKPLTPNQEMGVEASHARVRHYLESRTIGGRDVIDPTGQMQSCSSCSVFL